MYDGSKMEKMLMSTVVRHVENTMFYKNTRFYSSTGWWIMYFYEKEIMIKIERAVQLKSVGNICPIETAIQPI